MNYVPTGPSDSRFGSVAMRDALRDGVVRRSSMCCMDDRNITHKYMDVPSTQVFGDCILTNESLRATAFHMLFMPALCSEKR